MRKAIGAVSVVVGCTLVALPLGGVNSAVAEAAPQVSAVSLPMAAKTSAKKKLYKNCTSLNKKYKHGVGKSGAKDRTSGKRVTNFKKSTKIYNEAMSYNRGLDRDKDGIACEKR
ncbi:excalibur calcium-binding domain-containing protein [Micropruina sp.]|uniref:excalibur calcium-binding domain-containing protein n=1 Tax=Micropruina sp. TaxID=2737536 RepID=UPI002614D86A|nr:excalibur calcium-binding domain-containing protein [Micropruina sp.]